MCKFGVYSADNYQNKQDLSSVHGVTVTSDQKRHRRHIGYEKEMAISGSSAVVLDLTLACSP